MKEKKDIHSNQLQFRKAFKKFMADPQSSPNRQKNTIVSDYSEDFLPFIKERDHLGRMIGQSNLLKSHKSELLESENTRAQSELNNY